MRKQLSAHTLFILFLCIGVGPLGAALVAPKTVLYLEEVADVIVVGRSNNLVQNGSDVEFSLTIDRLIKSNNSLPASSIDVVWQDATSFNARLSENAPLPGFGIWFLRRLEDRWQVIPVLGATFEDIYFAVPSGPISLAYAYDSSASPHERLVAEISNAIESRTIPARLRTLLFSALLEGLDSPILKILYDRLASSPSVDDRLFGLSALIRTGDGAALEPAVQYRDELPDHPAATVLLMSIRDFFRESDSGSVQTLGEIALDLSMDLSVRLAAAHAVASIHTRESLPFLGMLLDAPELDLRVEAVGGLGAFANGLAIQTRANTVSLAYLQLPEDAPYRTQDTVAHLAFGRQAIEADETRYTTFWADWWQDNRSSLGY